MGVLQEVETTSAHLRSSEGSRISLSLSLSPYLSRASCQEVGPSRAHPLWQGPFCNPPDSSFVATPAARSSDSLSPSAFIGGVWDLSLSLSLFLSRSSCKDVGPPRAHPLWQ